MSNFIRSKVFFQEIKRIVIEIESHFFRRSKFSIIFENFVQEVNRTIMRSKA
jgi:hypothetical protein